MIPESEISECPEFEVNSKIGNIFVNGKILEVYSVKTYKIDPYFYEHYEKKYKFMKMDVNIYYLELMFILLNMSYPWKKVILTEILFLRRKNKKHQRKNLVVNLLELIRVKKTLMQTMKPAEYKLVNLKMKKRKIEKIRRIKQKKIKKLEGEMKKLKRQLGSQIIQ